MTMNKDLFLAILAMDSYNRGYNSGINGLPSSGQIGQASILNFALPSGSEAAGFYAISYDVSGVAGFSPDEKVISYRGTTSPPSFDFLQDLWNGYGVGAGFATGGQAELAAKFYKDVVGIGGDLQLNNITLTGHSMGAGLAGLIGSLYGRAGALFDNMAFELAAEHARSLALGDSIGIETTQYYNDLYYNGSTPWANNISNLAGYAVLGELVAGLRAGQVTPVANFNSYSELGPVDLHSQALLVTLMWASQNNKVQWYPAGVSLGRALFDNSIASSITDIASRIGPTGTAGDVFRDAIAYSAIDEGERPFGDTGIRAMFNDADDLGRALALANASSALTSSADALAKILVQFAGKLALGDVEGLNSFLTDGVLSLSEDQKSLAVDFGSSLWGSGAAHNSIIGRKELTDRALATLDQAGVGSDIRTGMSWLWNDQDSSIIDRIILQTTSEALLTTLPDRHSVGNDVSLFVAGDGNDTIYGASADEAEFIHGGAGNDSIRGGDGDDLIAGGAGDDTLAGGNGRDFLAGGAGIDTIDLGEYAASVNVTIRSVDATGEGSRSAIEIVNGSDIDRAIDVERILLSTGNDTVVVTDLGPTTGDPTELSRLGSIDFGVSSIARDVDTLDLSQAGRDYVPLLGFDVADAGVYVDLSDASRQMVDYYYDYGLAHTTGPGDAELVVRNANSVIATDFDDYLIGNGGSIANSEGFSTLYGRGGDDTLQGAGWESHLYGGTGADTFKVGANTWIEDGEVGVGDRVTYAGIPIVGGVKQWWMEGNKAVWSPFSSLATAFPVVGAELISTAAILTDLAFMKFASFTVTADGSLQMNLGWDQAGTAAIKDYSLDLDSGAATAGVTVFVQELLDANTAFKRLTNYVNLALKAGFGVGLNGWDPIILDLDGDGYELTTQGNSNVYFEFDGDGFGERAGWVRPDDGFLVLDANANGLIDDASEFFGDETQGGFAELATYDLNLDGVINAEDAAFASLRVWRDANMDGVSQAGELKTLAELGIVSIGLATTTPAAGTQVGGNMINAEGVFTRSDGTTGKAADVALDISHTATKWLGDTTVSTEAAALPELVGRGNVKDLRVAMSQDATLLGLVGSYAGNMTYDLATLKADAETILYRWAGVDGVAPVALGSNGFDSRKLAFLETYTGYELAPRVNGEVSTTNIAELEAMWGDTVERLTLRLAVQGPLAADFAGIEYRADRDLLVASTPTALRDALHNLLMELPASSAAAQAQWETWAPFLRALNEGLVRSDANLVRGDYVAAQLLAAMEGVSQPLSFQELSAAIGIDNVITGTTATDSLSRGALTGTAIYAGGAGSDSLTGGTGQDVYLLQNGFGQVVINDSEARESGDRIRFVDLNRSAVTLSRDGADLLITVTASGDVVRVAGQFADVVPLGPDTFASSNRGIEDIQFADGTIMEIPEIMSAVGTGTDGNDTISGTMHSDVLIGGKGNDLLKGGDDADLYVFSRGDGQDVIQEVQSTPLLRAADLLVFGDNLAPGDLVFGRSADGNDLIVSVAGTADILTITGQFSYSSLGYNAPLAPNGRIEAFAFREVGDSWSNKDIQQKLIRAGTTGGADSVMGFGDDDLFEASAGNDTLIGLDGADTYRWGMGAGNDVIDERAIYIDVEVGLGGISLTTRADTVEFGAGISLDDLVFSRPTEAPDLVVTLVPTGETLTVKNQFDGFQTGPLGPQWMDRVEWFAFADGNRVSWQDVLADVTAGGPGNDHLWGDLTQDTLNGGAGNDTLSGKGLGDVYEFGLGGGQDIIDDANTSFLGTGFITVDSDLDILRFGSGVLPEDIEFIRDSASSDVILKIAGTSDQVTLKGQDAYIQTGVFGALSTNRVERIEFANGAAWTWADLSQRIIAASTTTGNDSIYGFTLEDRFEASAGNDTHFGGESSDTYVFGRGSGQDEIRESVSNVLYGDQDIVEFASDVSPEDILVSRQGEDLILAIPGTSDQLDIKGEFAFSNWFSWSDIEEFRFASGTVWTKQDVQQRLLQATSGNDSLVGFFESDTLDGGAGNDTLAGCDGADAYVFGRGYGQDVIQETLTNANLSDDDELRFGADILPSDIVVSRAGNDLILSVQGTNDSVRVQGQFSFSNWYEWWDIERFIFANGTVWTKNDVSEMLLAATEGADTLVGTSDSDWLDGKGGNDLLQGGDGADTYIFGRGYGQDTIQETLTNANLSDDDRLIFGSGITLADLGFTRSGNDLIITIADTGESIRIEGEFNFQNWYTWWDVERFQFADGSFVTKEQLQQQLLAPTSGADHLIGFHTGDTLDGGAGSDTLEGGDGGDTYVFGRGYGADTVIETQTNANLSEYDQLVFAADVAPTDVDILRVGNDMIAHIRGTDDSVQIVGQFSYGYSSATNDIDQFVFSDGTVWDRNELIQRSIVPTSGNDTLLGLDESDTLDGGAGNDLLQGGEGNDTYVWGRGYGQDTIDDWYWYINRPEQDQLLLTMDVLPSDLNLARSGNDLIVTISGVTDQLTIKDQFSNIDHEIESFQFSDGTIWNEIDVQQKLLTAASTSGNDNITGFYLGDYMLGGAGNDSLYGVAGDDTLDGGDGNDWLEGGNGADVYVYNLGGGDDVINDYIAAWGSYDVLSVGAGIAPADLIVSQVVSDQNDVLLTFTGNPGSILLDNQWWSDAGVEEIRFADGTVWNEVRIATEYVSRQQTPGNDTIWGTGLSDTIDAGGGDDIIYEGAGDDTYVWNLGSGNDIVRGPNSKDGFNTLQFGSGITQNDIVFATTPDGRGLKISVNGQLGSITFEDQLVVGTSDGLDQIRFADSTIWDRVFIQQKATGAQSTAGNDSIVGTEAADFLFGAAGNDTIDPRGGDDRIIGGAGIDVITENGGNDTYVWNLGDGDDSITGGAWNDGLNTIEFGAGITAANLRYAYANGGGGLKISVDGQPGSVTIDYQLSGATDERIDQIKFAEDGTVLTRAQFEAAALGQLSTSGNDSLWGSGVSETINGAAGDDTIDARGGDDRIIGGLGNDTLREVFGNDTYVWNLGDGDDSITGGAWNDGLNTIEFGAGITAANLRYAYANGGGGLKISVDGQPGSVTIDYQLSGATDERIDQIKFAEDGTVLTRAQFQAAALAQLGTSANDTIWGSRFGETIDGRAGDDAIDARSGNDEIIGGLGNDTLQGGEGTDIYRYGAGDGDDVIFDYYGTRNNRLIFGTGIAVDDVLVSRSQADATDLRLTFKTISGSITFDHQTWSDAGVEFVEFADGTVLSETQLNASIIQATDGNNQLTGSSQNDQIWSLEGDDTIYGDAGDDRLEGQQGADELIGGEGADVLRGGSGNDILYGDSNISGLIAVGPNLLTNGGFETSGTIVGSYSWGKSNSTMPGWTKSNSQNFDQVYSGVEGVAASEGGFWLDLDSSGGAGSNMDIRQTVGNFNGGETVLLQFNHANRTSAASGSFDVLWNGVVIAQINETGTAMRSKDYALTAIAGDNVLSFVGTGTTDAQGASIDNVRLFAAQPSVGGDDILEGGDGNDRLSGGTGNDTLDGGADNDVAVFLGYQSSYTITTSGGTIQIVDNDISADGNDGTDTLIGVETAEFKGGATVNLAAPIVLDLDGNGVKLVDQKKSKAKFDWDGDGKADRTGWVGKGDGLLVYDRNGDGKISGANELSFLDDKPGAKSDLDGLSAFDSNGDGKFSSADAAWGSFKVWKDKNGDGKVGKKELLSLERAGVAAISLAGMATEREWAWGSNITINNGSFTRTNGTTGALGDVALGYQASGQTPASILRSSQLLADAMASFGGSDAAELNAFRQLATQHERVFAFGRLPKLM